MRVMVACTTLTWIEVDTETGEVGPARVFNLPENVEVEGRWLSTSPKKQTVIVADTTIDDEESVTEEIEKLAIAAVENADTYAFVMEEDDR